MNIITPHRQIAPDGPANWTPLASVTWNDWSFGLKIEGARPGDSHKARPVSRCIRRLLRAGLIAPCRKRPSILLISSSGNAANQLAKQTVGLNVEVIVFTDVLSGLELHDQLRAWPHVHLVVIDQPDASGSHAKARKAALAEYHARHPEAIEIDQYFHSDFPCGYSSLFQEIEEQVIDLGALLIPVGTCATARAATQYRNRLRRRWKIVAVDAAGSALNGPPIGHRLFSGFGNGAESEWARQAKPMVDHWVRVPDEATVQAAYWLQARGFALGASSAAAFAAATHLIGRGAMPHHGRPVLLCPDHAHGYSSTLFSPEFLQRHGLGHLARASA